MARSLVVGCLGERPCPRLRQRGTLPGLPTREGNRGQDARAELARDPASQCWEPAGRLLHREPHAFVWGSQSHWLQARRREEALVLGRRCTRSEPGFPLSRPLGRPFPRTQILAPRVSQGTQRKSERARTRKCVVRRTAVLRGCPRLHRACQHVRSGPTKMQRNAPRTGAAASFLPGRKREPFRWWGSLRVTSTFYVAPP